MRGPASLRSAPAWATLLVSPGSAALWATLLCGVAIAGPAAADPANAPVPAPSTTKGSPDNAGPLPEVADFDESFEEGLVEHSWAEGLTVEFGLRSAAFFATDCCRLRGFGGASSLRLSTWLSPRLRWVLRFDTAGIAARQPGNEPPGGERTGDEITLNRQSAVTLGVQAMRLGPVWLEGGLGLANYIVRSADETIPERNRDGGGLALVSAVGTNIFERGRWRIAVEVTFLGSLYTRIDDRREQGFIGQFGFGLSAGFQ